MNEARPGLGQAGVQIKPAQGLHPQPGAHAPAGTAPGMVRPPPTPHDESSLSLVDTDEPVPTPVATTTAAPGTPSAGAIPGSKIRQFSVPGAVNSHHDWKRVPHTNHTGAMRMRSFHGRLSEQGLDYMDNAINEWLDKHPEIEVKFVTSTTGMFDGKIKEPALILNVWY